MSLMGYLSLSLLVLTDFRVLAAALAVLLSWGLLRFVGVIPRRRPGYGLRGRVRRSKAEPNPSSGPEIKEE